MKNNTKRFSTFVFALMIASMVLMLSIGASAPANAASLAEEAQIAQLRPALIILGVVFVIEIIDIVILLSVKKSISGLGAFVAPLALTTSSMFTVVIGFAIVDLVLAGYIIYLVVSVVRAYKAKLQLGGIEELAPEAEELEPEPEPVAEPEPEPEATGLMELVSDEEHTHIENPMEHVSVEEANQLMTDEMAISFEHFEAEFITDESERDVYSGTKKAEINIDTICQNFEAGDRVTINSLKEKKLISSQTGYLKVLARGTMDKPLTIVAQNFSVSAVKMIILTGGSVILDDPAPEMRDK